MRVEFETNGPSINEGAVTAFEATLPRPLPSDYRTFLLTHNGGHLAPNWWPPEVSDADFGAHDFYSLGDVGHDSLHWIRETFSGRIPAHLLVIGDDANGNQLCLSLDQSEHGRIYFFDHERELDDDYPPDPKLFTAIAESFTELLATLEPEPSEEEMLRRVRHARPELDI